MENISPLFADVYLPKIAIVFYENDAQDRGYYVESYDMDEDGSPVNAHPLTVAEATELAKALDTSKELQKSFLKPKGLLPDYVLYIDPSEQGCALWYTPAQKCNLFFVKNLDIPNGGANVPALVWRATKTGLSLFALKDSVKPDLNSPLYHAPFFNMHQNGNVCMGTVDIQITAKTSLEEFMGLWQQYFWQSYFSHLIGEHNPVKGNIVQLWQKHVGSAKPFPASMMTKNKKTLKDLIR